VQDAATALEITLTSDEIHTMEALAAQAGVDTKGAWEKPMHS
jgi:hypothetical protein